MDGDPSTLWARKEHAASCEACREREARVRHVDLLKKP